MVWSLYTCMNNNFQRLGSLESTMANVQQSQLTAFSHDGNNIFTTSANNNANYPLVDTSVSLLLQQAAQFPNIILSQVCLFSCLFSTFEKAHNNLNF